jgi:hypothetical protein
MTGAPLPEASCWIGREAPVTSRAFGQTQDQKFDRCQSPAPFGSTHSASAAYSAELKPVSNVKVFPERVPKTRVTAPPVDVIFMTQLVTEEVPETRKSEKFD